MKKYTLIILLFAIISCKTKAIVTEKSKVTEKTDTEKIIEGHYNNKSDFSSLYIKANLKYKDAKQSQSATAEIRIKKNEVISLSIRFLGITIAKAMITPDRVQYYDKVNGKYFDGDYAALTDFLGTDLDFTKVQNLFIGKAIDDLKQGVFINSLEDKMFKLESISNENTKKTYYFNHKFHVSKVIINQVLQNRILEVNYLTFKEYPEGFFPENIMIDATQEKGNSNILFNYNSISFNEELSFPYSVPEGYERIFIK